MTDITPEAARAAAHRALLAATPEPPNEGDYHEGFEEGLKVGSRPSPPTEEQWEYGSAGYCFDWNDRICRERSADPEYIRLHAEEVHASDPGPMLRRRLKAGPWEPVEAAARVGGGA